MTAFFIRPDLTVSHVTINCRPTSNVKAIMPSISAMLPRRSVAKVDPIVTVMMRSKAFSFDKVRWPVVLRRNTSEIYPQKAKTTILSKFSQLLKKIPITTTLHVKKSCFGYPAARE